MKDISKLFPLATHKEIQPWLSKRSRSVINQIMLRSDTCEPTYKKIPKMSGLAFYNINRQFQKLLGKY